MTFNGADTNSMDRMALACLDGVKVINEQISHFKTLKPWLYGPSAVVAIKYLRGPMTRTLEAIAEALREMAMVLMKHAEAQRRASMGETVDFAALPQYRRRILSPEQRARFAGVIQMAGGSVEAGGAALTGTALLFAPEPLFTKLAAGTLLLAAAAHGVDQVTTGSATYRDGTPHETVTHEVVAVLSKKAGASEAWAERIATVADLAGGGLQSGAGLLNRSVVELAEQGGPALFVAYEMRPNASTIMGQQMGHNMVGVREVADGPVKWFELIGGPGQNTKFVPVNTARLPDVNEFAEVKGIGVTAGEAAGAVQRIEELRGSGRLGEWNVLGPNCATSVGKVLSGADAAIPPPAGSTPWLLYKSFNPPSSVPAGIGTTGGLIAPTGKLGGDQRSLDAPRTPQ